MITKQEAAFRRLQEWQENEGRIQAAEAQAKALTAEPESARDLLCDPCFFSRLLADFAKAGLVGERKNALAAYTIATSRLREKPLNAVIKGGSSAGKNHLAKTALMFFPEHEVVGATSMTEHAVDYAGANHLAHKVVYIDEQTGMSHPLRQLISEGRQTRWTSTMIDGRRVMQERVTQGPIACITTTTENALSIDDENRNFSLWIDESYRQTQAITKAQAVAQREPISPRRLRLWRDVQQILSKFRRIPIRTQPWFVDIAQKILPYGDLRIRRYWPAFIEACKVVALIGAAGLCNPSDDEITVRFKDFAIALCIFDSIIGESLTRSGGDAEMAVGDLVERLSQSSPSGVTAGDLVGQPNIRSLDQAYRALRRARAAGAIYILNERERNNEKRYARSPAATFLGNPELIVMKLGLKISGNYIHPVSGHRIEYGKE